MITESASFYSIVEAIPFPLIGAKMLAKETNVSKACIRDWVSRGSLPPYDWRMSSQTYGWRKETLQDFFTDKRGKRDVKKNTTTESNGEHQKEMKGNNEEQGMNEMSDFEKSLQSNPNVEKRSIPVYLIKDLDLLKRNPYNRDINQSSVKKYVEEGVLPDTIFLINEKGEILDGQHRIEACKELNQPVWVQIVPNGDEFFIKKINTLGTVWSMIDHVKFYAQQGNSHYQKLQLMLDKYNRQKPITSYAIMCAFSGAGTGGGNLQTSVKAGKWKVRVRDEYVLPVLDYLVELGKINVHFNNILKQVKTAFVSDISLFVVEYVCLGNDLDNFKKRFEKALPLLATKLSEHKMDIFDTLSDVVSYNRKTNRFDYKTERPMYLKHLDAGQYL